MKKHTLLICVSTSLLLLSVSCGGESKSDKNNTQKQSISLKISPSLSKPFNPLLLGANVNFTQRPYGSTDSRVVEMTRPLRMNMMRYPGGGHANWWNWKTGTYHEDKTLSQRVPPDRHNNMTAWRANMDKYHGGKETVDDFVTFCRNVDATPIWVANLFSGTPAENAEWVAYNRSKNYSNIYWELGNEYYLGGMRSRYPTAHDYVKEAREHTAAMKKNDPSVRVAIVGTSDRFRPERKERGGDGVWIEMNDDTEWNNIIAKDKFYDAVTVHDYMVTSKEIVGEDVDSMHRYLMARNPLTLPNFVAYFKKTFGDDMKLWFTEWNINPYLDRALQGKNNKKNNRPQAATHTEKIDTSPYWHTKSMSHALYVADWLLQAADFPETIESAHIHVLAAPFFWGLFQLDNPEEKNMDKPFRKNPPYYAIMLMGEAARGADRFQFIDTLGGPQMKGAVKFAGKTFPQLVAGAFFSGDKERAVFVINKGANPVNINLATATRKTAAEIACAWADEPIAGWGEKKQGSENNYRQEIQFERAAGGDVSNITLRPYSITKIRFGTQ